MRRRRTLLIAAALVVFVVVSGLLAQVLTGATPEREPILALLRAQASGDAAGMLRELPDCDAQPGCPARIEALARRLKRPGKPKILSLGSDTAYGFGRSTGPTRVAWTTLESGGAATVQCVEVRRDFSLTSGASATLLRLGGPIDPESSC
jgi:hypothetical protein